MGPNIIACVMTMLVLSFGQFSFVFDSEWTVSEISGKLFNSLFCFVFITIIAMLFTYVAMIRGKMSNLILENLNLLDKMHEGLIVLSQDCKVIQLASKPAVYLLK